VSSAASSSSRPQYEVRASGRIDLYFIAFCHQLDEMESG
jgi:hypothetical protein